MSTKNETETPPSPPADPTADPVADPPVSEEPAIVEPSELEQAFTQLQGDFDTPTARLRLHGTQSEDPRDLHAVVLNEKGEPLASSNARLLVREKAIERGLNAVAEAHGVLRIRAASWQLSEEEQEQAKKEKEKKEREEKAASEASAEQAQPAKAASKGRR